MNLFEDLKTAIKNKNFEIDSDDFFTINLKKETPDSFNIEVYRDEDNSDSWDEDCWRVDIVTELKFVSVNESEIYKDSDINLTDEQEQELINLIDFEPVYY